MGAGDWFAANGGKGQAALCSLLLISQSHCCIPRSAASPTFYYYSWRWERQRELHLVAGVVCFHFKFPF